MVTRRKNKQNEMGKAYLILLVCALLAVTVFGLIRTSDHLQLNASGAIVYTDGGSQILALNPNGTFLKVSAHGNNVRGTYTQEEPFIFFSMGNKSVIALLIEDVFLIPEEWKDACGHNQFLHLRR
jgi:hypothetical protein